VKQTGREINRKAIRCIDNASEAIRLASQNNTHKKKQKESIWLISSKTLQRFRQ
jgi:hypothetical protein